MKEETIKERYLKLLEELQDDLDIIAIRYAHASQIHDRLKELINNE